MLVGVVKDSGCRKRQGVTQHSVHDLAAQWGRGEFKRRDLEETLNYSGTAVFDEDGKSGKDYEKIEGNNQLEWDTLVNNASNCNSDLLQNSLNGVKLKHKEHFVGREV